MPRTIEGSGTGRSYKLHLRCRCCQRDAFQAVECPATSSWREEDGVIRRVVGGISFLCNVCPGESADLVAYTPIQQQQDKAADAA
jgi:hypothetical protein